MTTKIAETVFSDFAKINKADQQNIKTWGKTLVVAPHPDDESLGCGGAIALLRKNDCEVSVLTMSDGTLSHPNSKKFPPEKLRNLRESEMTEALNILGVNHNKIKFLRFRDRNVPDQSAPGFLPAVETVKEILAAINPQTIFLPWRRDPHPDHRASWQIVTAALSGRRDLRIFEYPIWLWEMAEKADLPDVKAFRVWWVNINEVFDLKFAAIRAHRSQTTDLIDDDPEGFRLSPEMLEHFSKRDELYLEEVI